jgi:hypothetical protein
MQVKTTSDPAQVGQLDDGTTVVGAEAIAAMVAHFTEQQEARRTVLRKMPAKVRRDYLTFVRTGRLPEVRARAPREARNDRPGGSRRSSVRRSSERSGDSGDPDEEPARVCANARCRADISHLHPLAEFCDNRGACKQQAYRDRLTHKHLEELVGTVAHDLACGCNPKGHLVIGGVCFHCGRPRGGVTRAWLDDGLRARPFVSSRAPARRNPRLGERKRKPLREYVDKAIIRTPAEIVAERLRILEAFIAEHGMDYWDRHDTAPEQLDLESEAA